MPLFGLEGNSKASAMVGRNKHGLRCGVSHVLDTKKMVFLFCTRPVMSHLAQIYSMHYDSYQTLLKITGGLMIPRWYV